MERITFDEAKRGFIDVWSASDGECDAWVMDHGDPQPIDPSDPNAPPERCTFDEKKLSAFCPSIPPENAISYHVARGILIERLGASDDEILFWVCWHGRPRLYSDIEGQFCAIRASHFIALQVATVEMSPYESLIPYRFSRDEIERLDPGAAGFHRASGIEGNPSGRYLTYSQAVAVLCPDLPQDQVEAQVELAVRRGRMTVFHPTLRCLDGIPQKLAYGAKPQVDTWLLAEMDVLDLRRDAFGIGFEREDEISRPEGKPADAPGKLGPSQQDKADFQQRCLQRWDISPTLKNQGPGGVVDLEARGYLKVYTRKTLEEWATEVDPRPMREKGGRPRKTPPE